jgi:hypothetical protein
MNKNKIVTIIIFLILCTWAYTSYVNLCESSPECACKNATPGDITCMSAENLSIWCESNVNSVKPQCNLMKNEKREKNEL